MEVHKHPHHVTHKKKWTEYLLEFFMLFLAVFLGFVAENIREHIAEKERGKSIYTKCVGRSESRHSYLQMYIGSLKRILFLLLYCSYSLTNYFN